MSESRTKVTFIHFRSYTEYGRTENKSDFSPLIIKTNKFREKNALNVRIES